MYVCISKLYNKKYFLLYKKLGFGSFRNINENLVKISELLF